MKTFSLLLCTISAATFLASCTTTTTTTTAQSDKRPDVEMTTEKRSYSAEELKKRRGGTDIADSLEAQDASVRIDRR
jgi:hypothetical protein